MKKNLLLRFDWINGYGLPVFRHKTRALAREMIEGGKAHYSVGSAASRAKSSRSMPRSLCAREMTNAR